MDWLTVWIGCGVLGLLYGLVMGKIKSQDAKMEREKRELAKWQRDLEKKASKLH